MRRPLYLKTQSVPRCKHTFYLGYKNSQFMFYREIIAAFSEIHTKHINAFWPEHKISER